MDDLSQKIQTILSDEESMKQISELAAMLGLGTDAPADGASGTNFANPGASANPFGTNAGAANPFSSPEAGANALSQLLGGAQQSTQSGAGQDILGGLNAAKLASLASTLKSSGAEDENIRFILALKPLLSAKRQARADGAVRILRLLNMIPLIKASGLLGELLG